MFSKQSYLDIIISNLLKKYTVKKTHKKWIVDILYAHKYYLFLNHSFEKTLFKY